MSKLGDLLFGNTRGRLLALLLMNADRAYHLRGIARRCRVSPGTVHRELAKLEETGLVLRTQQDGLVRFRANRLSPVFLELVALLKKTVGLVDVLRDALQPHSDRIEVAAVFGSVARGEERSDSDVDLLVVGDIDFLDLVESLRDAQSLLGREINPVVYPRAEYAEVREARDAFLCHVLADPLLFILGTRDDLGEPPPNRPTP